MPTFDAGGQAALAHPTRRGRRQALTPEARLAAEVAALVAAQPMFAPILERAGPPPLRAREPGFAGLAGIILGQQISIHAARAIHDRLVAAIGPLTAADFAGASDATLRTAGLSAGKVRTLRALAEAILGGLDLGGLGALEAEAAIAELVRLHGVGRWTAEVYLLFALGHADVFPAGDLALQEGARLAFALPERPSEKALRALAAPWQPRRGIAARLLWAYYRAVRGLSQATPA
ncbi:MAG TPA: DNA-3-methyladenine glycosylase 2 family protein [Hyphomicrobiales bacterium]|nr:DNA-3-methyladenine glycosylase 2 family protein [Hyphomicrobiales bacterium]